MSNLSKRILRKIFRQFGWELREIESRGSPYPRQSILGSLFLVNKLGLQPGTCIDVGAAFGEETQVFATVFPSTKILMVEPLKEYESFLEHLCQELPNVDYIQAAAGNNSKKATINVHHDLVGSSMLSETEGKSVDGLAREINLIALDNLCEDSRAPGPYLIKIDTQGYELEVLKGAQRILPETEYILMELSLFRFFHNGPQFDEVVDFMKSRGFVLYDIINLKYRPLDDALAQVDAAFVPADGILRRNHAYAFPAQLRKHDERFAEVFSQKKRALTAKKDKT